MPRMQVYLPADLYQLVKAHALPASELLQKAVRAELRRLELEAETDRFVKSLLDSAGQPTARERVRARALAARIAQRKVRKAG